MYKLRDNWFHEEDIWETIVKQNFQGGSILEIGSWEGRSALWMLDNLNPECLYCVDIFSEHPSSLFLRSLENVKTYEQTFDKNIASHPIGNRVTKIKSKSYHFLKTNLRKFNMVYVDGSHRVSDVFSDLSLSWEFLNDGGILVCDDYNQHGPAKAMNKFMKFIRNEGKILHKGIILVIQKRYKTMITEYPFDLLNLLGLNNNGHNRIRFLEAYDVHNKRFVARWCVNSKENLLAFLSTFNSQYNCWISCSLFDKDKLMYINKDENLYSHEYIRGRHHNNVSSLQLLTVDIDINNFNNLSDKYKDHLKQHIFDVIETLRDTCSLECYAQFSGSRGYHLIFPVNITKLTNVVTTWRQFISIIKYSFFDSSLYNLVAHNASLSTAIAIPLSINKRTNTIVTPIWSNRRTTKIEHNNWTNIKRLVGQFS